VDVKEGDIITAVNGKSVLEARDIADLLLNQADKQVLLQVKRKAETRAVIVLPVTMAKQRRCATATGSSRARQVEAASKGRIGYLHLRAMGPNDIASFARDFYANVNREGLIIDVRRNNGGNIDSWIIEKLLRKAWAFWAPPGVRRRRICRTPSAAIWRCSWMNTPIRTARPSRPASSRWASVRWSANAPPAPGSGSAITTA
jgi:tricorn protease